MATRTPQPATPPTALPSGVLVTIPTSITIKDVVVIITALITIISSWTFYTMRLSVQETKLTEYKVQMEKVQGELELIHKDIQDLRLKSQAIEIRQSLTPMPQQSNSRR